MRGLIAGLSVRSFERDSVARFWLKAWKDLGGCQNYGPFWVPIIIRHLLGPTISKRDHNFDNHPLKSSVLVFRSRVRIVVIVRHLASSSSFVLVVVVVLVTSVSSTR